MLVVTGVLFGGIFAYKLLSSFIIRYAISHQVKLITVTTMKVDDSTWQSELSATGSLRAIKGVNITTELAGMVQTIDFTPGSPVKENQRLVQLNADTELAQLHALQANAELAKITYTRDKAQYAVHAVSKQILDNDAANLKNLDAQVQQQATLVAKKSIKAPFSGFLGINQINPGQYLNPGDAVVTLQTLDPLYVDFFLPQQNLAQLQVNQTVLVTTEAYPHQVFEGKITTINPLVDPATRNVEVEATLKNPKLQLKPGMFVEVSVVTGKPQSFLTVPQTAISFNPYGAIVFIIRESGKDKQGKPILIANQHFVKTGETRGEQVQILQGLQKGDEIVTSGQLKLKNGSLIVVDNSHELPNNPKPSLNNNH